MKERTNCGARKPVQTELNGSLIINTMEGGKQNNTYRIPFYRCVVIDR